MKIVVLAGGLSPERNVSLSSGTMITHALRSLGHQAALVDMYFGLEDYDGPLEAFFDRDVTDRWKQVDPKAPDLEAVKRQRKWKSPNQFGQGVLALCQMADIVFLAGASPRDFIRSGYLSSFDWNLAPEFYAGNRNFASYHAKYAPVYLRLSEIDGDSLMLLDPRFFLVFTTPPTSGAAHRFTLTITDNKSKEIRFAFDWTGKS